MDSGEYVRMESKNDKNSNSLIIAEHLKERAVLLASFPAGT